MKRSPKLRLFVTAPLAPGATVPLAPEQSHYLLNVMRQTVGDNVAVFNGKDGEWRAAIAEAGRKSALLRVEALLRPQAGEPDLWLVFAPVKRQRVDFIVEKATELGVSALLPVWTINTQTQRVKDERLTAIAREAAEQCRRLSVPEVAQPCALDALLAGWPKERVLLLLDEKGQGRPIAEVLAALPPGPAAFLVGPEGGFTETELDALRGASFAVGIGLGPRILRAETAVVAALSCYGAIAGDWRAQPGPPSSRLSNMKAS